ncbi:MAG: ccmE [Nevskia sp.]|nr:ccmE [Nevskia sp.]
MSGMSKRQKRMSAVIVLLIGVGTAAALGFTAFRKNMMYFYTPSDLLAGAAPAGATLQLGGLVEKGSLRREEGLKVAFVMADCEKQLPVSYEGILPDLFREGQGVVATGKIGIDPVSGQRMFVASQILAKHDENYMPPQVAASLKTADGKHSCAPFKSVYKPMTAATDAPRS